MNALAKIGLILTVLAAAVAGAYRPAMNYWHERNRPKWKTVAVESGNLVSVINSTGTIKPVLSVSIGSFVSGPIVKLNVDFNDEVKEGDILAQVDPRLFEANVARDQATIASREAEVERVEAQLHQAVNNKQRGEQLRDENEDFLSDREMDALFYEVKALEALLKLSKASVLQAKANLENSVANLEYTDITSPVDGMVIKRNIDPGQTLAAQFQTPELFVVAPDLRKKVHVFASVDQADIGRVQRAQVEARPVSFHVDAYPDELFEGEIEQIRMSSESVQNVVTYPVVVAAANPELKLLPGMTASISFEVASKREVIKVPKSALRFYPDIRYVRPADRGLLDGTRNTNDETHDDDQVLSAPEKALAQQNRDRRHVWVVDGNFLRAVEVVTGLDDTKFSELLSGELKPGDRLVTGQETK